MVCMTECLTFSHTCVGSTSPVPGHPSASVFSRHARRAYNSALRLFNQTLPTEALAVVERACALTEQPVDRLRTRLYLLSRCHAALHHGQVRRSRRHVPPA